MKQLRSAKSSQRGAVVAIFVIAMIVIIGVAGLALDVSHAYVNKTRMQNILDASAMSGAMTLTQLGNDSDAEVAARDDAIATFDAAVQDEFATAGLTPTIEFSRTLDPFNPGSTPAAFVRARIDQYDMPTWLARVLGKETIRVGASAVAGPVNIDTCEIAPIFVCGDMTGGCSAVGDTCYGYPVYRPGEGDPQEECFLKTGPKNPNDTVQDTGEQCGAQASPDGTYQTDDPVDRGNFHALDLKTMCASGNVDSPVCDKSGADLVAHALAGGINYCPDEDDPIPTQTGNLGQKATKGLNTRFGNNQGDFNDRSEYAPDLVTDFNNPINGTDPVVYYGEYLERLDSGGVPGWDEPNDGVPKRRILPVVIADCTNFDAKTVKPEAVGCFYLTQPMTQGGGRIWGQFVNECSGNGSVTLAPTAFTQEKIILYKDPDSTDS